MSYERKDDSGNGTGRERERDAVRSSLLRRLLGGGGGGSCLINWTGLLSISRTRFTLAIRLALTAAAADALASLNK